MDENGEPLVVWHGSHWDPLAEEPGKAVFDFTRADSTRGMWWGAGNYFSDTKAGAEWYGRARAYFLNLRNPLDLRTEDGRLFIKEIAVERGMGDNAIARDIPPVVLTKTALRRGFDGFIAPATTTGNIEFVEFNQDGTIKSATDNTGVFSARPDVRYSISGLYTGSAADYAERVPVLDKDGNVTGYRIDNAPSLVHVGTGEGSQVYGWGLYASDQRGVAEVYANEATGDPRVIARNFLDHFGGDRKSAVDAIRKGLKSSYLRSQTAASAKRAIRLLQSGKDIPENVGNVYEQTFFTDRADGEETESHLLKWYEEVPRDTFDRIVSALKEEGRWGERDGGRDILGRPETIYGTLYGAMRHSGGEWTGGDVYELVRAQLGADENHGAREASEWLAAHGIDGVKYPVDSFGGKGVKDGDVAGWNYVSFRDDNIRVDHKWVDGVQHYSFSSLSVPEIRRAQANQFKDPDGAVYPTRYSRFLKRPISDALDGILDRLNHGEWWAGVQADIEATPEWQEAMARRREIEAALPDADGKLGGAGETRHLPATSERTALQVKIASDQLAPVVPDPKHKGETYTVAREKKIWIITGLPSAGKSSVFADRLCSENHARLVDSDEVKKALPEFNDGFGANAVHEESKAILEEVLSRALARGENIVHPILGKSAAKLEKLISTCNSAGYLVYIDLNEVPPAVSMARLVQRFLDQGRFLPLECVIDGGTKPTEAFHEIKRHYRPDSAERERLRLGRHAGSGLLGRENARLAGVAEATARGDEENHLVFPVLSGYERRSNDVAFGQPPVLLEKDGVDYTAPRESFTPIGAGLANESIFAGLLAADYVSGKDRGAETYERLRRALHVEDAGTVAEAKAYAREMAEVRKYGTAGRAEASMRAAAAQEGADAASVLGDAPSPDWTAEDYAYRPPIRPGNASDRTEFYVNNFFKINGIFRENSVDFA